MLSFFLFLFLSLFPIYSILIMSPYIGQPIDSAPKEAWVTLLTRSSYLPGVLTLAYTLRKHGTRYPLIVVVTPSLPAPSLRALELEASHNPLLLVHPTNPLLPPSNQPTTLITARFEDTWTKLRVFELTTYTTLIFLDADITIFRNMDDAFSIVLPGRDWLGANHACVCNLDRDSWAPDDWNAHNCAYTPLRHPSALTSPTPIPHSTDTEAKPMHRFFNSGLFIFHPSDSLLKSLLNHFSTSQKLSTYKFPDQDFLNDFFADRCMSIGWQYNALKTMRNWHENIWRDEEVRGLHYIVDKPWERRVASDGIGGYLGRDGVTHEWWWDIWEEWRAKRRGELGNIVDELVAKPLDEKGDRRQREENKEKGFPVPIPVHPGIAVDGNGTAK